MDAPKPIKIYNLKNEFIFSNEKKEISFNKSSSILKKLENKFIGNQSKEYNVNAILGSIEAKLNNYIVCANKVTFVGKLLDASVYKIK